MTSFVKQETLDKDFVSPSVWFPKMLTNTCRDGVCLWITIQAFICKVWFTCSLQLSRQVSVSSLLFARNLYLHEMMVYLCFSCLEVCFLFLWHSFIHSQPDLLFSRHSVKRRPQREASLRKNIMIMTFDEQRVTLEISNCFSFLCSPFPHITMLEARDSSKGHQMSLWVGMSFQSTRKWIDRQWRSKQMNVLLFLLRVQSCFLFRFLSSATLEVITKRGWQSLWSTILSRQVVI